MLRFLKTNSIILFWFSFFLSLRLPFKTKLAFWIFSLLFKFYWSVTIYNASPQFQALKFVCFILSLRLNLFLADIFNNEHLLLKFWANLALNFSVGWYFTSVVGGNLSWFNFRIVWILNLCVWKLFALLSWIC